MFSMRPRELLRRRKKEPIIGICSIGGQQFKPAERRYSSRCRAFCSWRRNVTVRGTGGRVNGTRRDGRGQMLRLPSLWSLRIMIRSRLSFVSLIIFMLPPLLMHRLLLVASINQDLKRTMLLLRSVLIQLPLSAGGSCIKMRRGDDGSGRIRSARNDNRRGGSGIGTLRCVDTRSLAFGARTTLGSSLQRKSKSRFDIVFASPRSYSTWSSEGEWRNGGWLVPRHT